MRGWIIRDRYPYRALLQFQLLVDDFQRSSKFNQLGNDLASVVGAQITIGINVGKFAPEARDDFIGIKVLRAVVGSEATFHSILLRQRVNGRHHVGKSGHVRLPGLADPSTFFNIFQVPRGIKQNSYLCSESALGSLQRGDF